MAATGLLGFNPYGKGVAIDFSSKPTQLAIQLEQREQAKREALDKYLMDYEKSINSAGMRKAESNIFLNKLSENKAFYIQNRDKILNPAKYGYDAQSQYMSNFKDMTNLIDQSKQAAANDKITTQHFITQKNLNAPDGYAEAVEASHLPITDPRYRPLDVTKYRFYKSHDPMEYANKIYSKIPLSESAPLPIPVKEMPGYFYTKTTSKVSPEYRDALLQEGYTNYSNDEGLRKEMNNVFNSNKDEVKRLEAKYNTKIPNAQALAGVYTWDLQPIKEATSEARPSAEYTSKLIASRQKGRASAGSEVAKFLEGGVTALNTNNASFINDYFKPWKAQTKTGTGGDVIGFQNIELLPNGTVKVNYSTPMTKSKKGTSFVFANPQSRIFNPKSSSLLQELTSLHQELLGSSVKAEDVAYTDTNPTPPPLTDGNKATKGKSPIIWKK